MSRQPWTSLRGLFSKTPWNWVGRSKKTSCCHHTYPLKNPRKWHPHSNTGTPQCGAPGIHRHHRCRYTPTHFQPDRSPPSISSFLLTEKISRCTPLTQKEKVGLKNFLWEKPTHLCTLVLWRYQAPPCKCNSNVGFLQMPFPLWNL